MRVVARAAEGHGGHLPPRLKIASSSGISAISAMLGERDVEERRGSGEVHYFVAYWEARAQG